jgi:TetR/AcrR family transcriptional regulator
VKVGAKRRVSGKSGKRSGAPVRRVPEETRSHLVTAAKRLFARSGLHGVAVSEIAKQAGVSAAMINHHFGGKEGLYRACIEGFGAARLRALDALLVAPANATEFEVRLDVLVTQMLELHLEDPDAVSILLRDANAAEHWGPDVERTLYEFTLKLATFFALAQERGVLRADVDPLTPAAVIYLSLSGLLQIDAHRSRVTGMSVRDPKERREIVKRLIDVVLRGVAR